MWRNILTIALKSAPAFRRLTSKLNEPQKRCFKTVLVLNGTAVALATASENKLDFLIDLEKACIKNDEALKELIEVIAACFEKISKEYQVNLEKQIEIINRCTKLGPIGEHWDELTEYRVQATELKEELVQYEVLAQKVGHLAYNQALTSFLSGVNNAMDLVEVDYSKLESLVIRLAKDNYQWEAKLLYANRDSILATFK